jgi:hypothetical protein
MFNIIWNNKEWLFSGIGVFILSSLIGLFIWQKNRKNFSRFSDRSIDFRIKRPELSIESKNQLKQAQPEPLSPPATPIIPSFSLITIDEIFDQISSVPVLLQDEIIKHFVGIRIKWAGKLMHITKDEKDNNNLNISLFVGSTFPRSVYFSIDASEYPGIGLLKEYHMIQVEGEIESFYIEDIYLKNTVIKF